MYKFVGWSSGWWHCWCCCRIIFDDRATLGSHDFSISLHARWYKYYCNSILQKLVIIWAKQDQKKNRKTQRECTLRGLHRENEERKRHIGNEREVCTERVRAREAIELNNSCASLKNKYGDWIFTSSCSSRRGGKSWRSANDEEEKKKKLAPNLNYEEEEERASSLQVCGWRKGRRLGERKSSSNAKLGHYSVYLKPALLRCRLSLLVVLPMSVLGS